MAKPTPTFYVLHGDDDFSLEQEVKRMRALMNETPNGDLNTSEFEGTTVETAEIVAAANAYPFLADKRMVIVKGFLGWVSRKGAGNMGKKAIEQLLDELPRLPEWSRLMFVERQPLADSNKIIKLAREHANGYEHFFALPKDSTGWIMKRAREEYGAEMESRAAVALATVTQNNLRAADNELFKLAAYVNGERAIGEADVALLTPYMAEASMFAMVDALAERRGQEALRLLHRLLEEQEDVFGVYGMIIRQFRLLLLAREYLDGGGYPKNMAEALHVHGFVAQKLAKQSRSFTLAQLERIYDALLDTDVKIKTGRIKPELALDLLVASLAG